MTETLTLSGVRRRPREDAPPRFKITITGPAKGPRPIVFEVEAPDAKTASLYVRKLIATGRMSVEQA